MRITCTFLLGIVVLLAVGIGCDRSQPRDTEVSMAPLDENPDTIVRLHWQGRRKLGVNGSAYYFMRLWDLPDSQKLQDQVLDKLARAPWRFYGQPADTGAPEAFLRPVIDDIIRVETFLEVRQSQSGSTESVIVAHLNPEQAGAWFTNLAASVQLLTGLAPQSSVQDPDSWVVRSPRSPGLIELRRVGDWTVLGIAQTENSLLAEVVDRVAEEIRPVPAPQVWMEGDIDLARLSQALGLTQTVPKELPRMSFSVTGDGARVLTEARLRFLEPYQVAAGPWKPPTELMHGPLTSFTAIRGSASQLQSVPLWSKLELDEAPDQLFFWARGEGFFQTYFAAPSPEAARRVDSYSNRVMDEGNNFLTNRGYIPFQRIPDGNGVIWGYEGAFLPFMRSAKSGGQGFILGGGIPEPQSSSEASSLTKLLRPLQARTNLVYYDWEDTPARIEPWLFLSQNARVISRHSQLPMELTASVWLGNLIRFLDASETVITRTAPNELSLSRKSTTGFTAPELHLLIDWFESPGFPAGVYSLSAATR